MRPETGNNILECKKILIPFSEYQNLKGSLSDFEQAILILQRENADRNNKIDSLQKDMQSLKAENDHIAFSRQNALSEVSSFETRLNSKNDVIFQLQEEIKKLEHLLNVDKGTWIKKENDNLKKEIETLRSKLAGCEKTT